VIRKKVILITGPTASGKTALAISIALRLSTRIISADSRQCFTEMNIGVAKPSADELASVKHYFINSHSIHDSVNAGTFESYALHSAAEIFEQHDIAVMAGGTGLYIRAFCEGLDEIPPVSNGIRKQVIDLYDQKGLEWLRNEVAVKDPLYYSKGEIQNPQRLMRALEVKLSTGRSIKEFQQQKTTNRDFDIIKYAIDIQRSLLNDHINNRVDGMIANGLVDEARSMLPYRHLNALQTVGYTELFDFFDGNCTLPQAIDRIKINTRHYAKRQMTWLRKDQQVIWIKEVKEIKI
jgi:tRNA dimethylallyltransferase